MSYDGTNIAREQADGIDPSSRRVLILLLVAAFVAILNETTMGIAIPHLNRDLGLPPELGQWMTSSFMLAMAVVIPTTGFLLQRFTTRQVFLAAMSLFSLGTLIALIAPGFVVLLVGRVVQALGTGVMMPLLMTTMMTVVPPHLRGRMMGRVSMVISLAPAIGPLLSGLILDQLSWRWIFALILPIALISLALGAKFMTNLGDTREAPIDALSVVLSALAFGGIVFGLSQLGAQGIGATSAPADLGIVILVAGLAVLGLFVWRQLRLQRKDAALLDLRVFKSGNFTVSVLVMGIIGLAMFGTLTLLPLYLQNGKQLEGTETGLVLLPGSVLMGLLGPVMGRIYDARGPRILLVPGTLVVTAVLFFYSTLSADTPVWAIAIAQTLMFIGMAASFTPLFTASLGSLKPHLYSHGSSVVGTVQQVAGAVGVAVMIGIYASTVVFDAPASVADAFAAGRGFFVAMLVSAVAFVLAWFVRKPADDGSAHHSGGH